LRAQARFDSKKRNSDLIYDAHQKREFRFFDRVSEADPDEWAVSPDVGRDGLGG
jgi:hypothetical protein